MRSLQFVGLGAIAFGLLSGCHSGSSSSVIPLVSSAVRSDTSNCAGAKTLTVCISIPHGGTKVVVTDTIYGDSDAIVGQITCPGSGSAYFCAASFNAPGQTLNQIQIDESGSETASGTFPVLLNPQHETKHALLEGSSLSSISKLTVVPFHSTSAQPGGSSNLPLGQTEQVWIVATDAEGDVIVGPYKKPISITPSSNAEVSTSTLKSTAAAEDLTVSWVSTSFTKASSPDSGTLTARDPSSHVTGKAHLRASSGVIYYPAGPDKTGYGPGPAALSPDGQTVYFVINDDSDAGCRALQHCTTLLERFTPATRAFAHVALRNVPGVSQLYVTSDGALWMATFQPVGAWNNGLPGLRMPPNQFSAGALQTLSVSDFGEPSGFAADPSGNLWISSCKGRGKTSDCKQNHDGAPILVETSIQAPQVVEATVDLPAQCMAFGYFGFSVGDVVYYGQDGDLYVLGINNGSAPPARGTIWRVSPKTHGARCPKVPPNFNPEPYFAPMSNSAGTSVLVFGAGNNANFRWFPNHGFYILTEAGTGNDKIIWDNGPGVTANHVSVAPAPSASPGILYYASSGKLDLRFSGLGTYEPSANPTASPGSQWSIFPSASFSGDQSDNGVAAASTGAWYTANGVCADPKTNKMWNGVCLADAIYLSNWGALPSLKLSTILTGNSSGFGVITNPQGSGSEARPFNVHSGPFYTRTRGYNLNGAPDNVCSVQLVTDLTFSVTGLKSGSCQIQILQKVNGKVLGQQPLITTVS